MTYYDDDYWQGERYEDMYYDIHGHFTSEPCPEDCKGRDRKAVMSDEEYYDDDPHSDKHTYCNECTGCIDCGECTCRKAWQY